ncbi:MAG: glycosyltransferase family 4 protein [Candidatus Promineifilaceae bacterium]
MRIAFLLARYGTSIIGGAEALGRHLAYEAVRRGWDVEVWTTCATEYVTWENMLPAGVSAENGVVVRRFPVEPWDARDFHDLNGQIAKYIDLTVSDEYRWIRSGPRSPALEAHVRSEAPSMDVVVTMPYLSPITYNASWLAVERLVIWPCLHQEMFAHMEPFRLLLESAYGVVFLSPEEAEFALMDLGLRLERWAIAGSGVSLTQVTDETTSMYEDGSPYLLYVGRLDHGKNVALLYEFMRRYTADGGRLRLLVAGDGSCIPPDRPEISYLGAVDEEEKSRLFAGAVATCQPSLNESFSMVLMESWLAGRPGLVWAGCDVTRGHVQRSKGGLWFENYAEFKAACDWLLDHPQLATRMGQNGNQYVRQNFAWESVFGRFAEELATWQKKALAQGNDR